MRETQALRAEELTEEQWEQLSSQERRALLEAAWRKWRAEGMK